MSDEVSNTLPLVTAIDDPEGESLISNVEDPNLDSRLDVFFEGEVDDSNRGAGAVAVPAAIVERLQERRLRARKVRRLVRHIEPWSVLKVSLLFYFCMWIVVMVAGVLLWNAAEAAGTITSIESFTEGILGLKEFTLEGEEIFNAVAIVGLLLTVAATGFSVLIAILLNLISDLTGGIRVTVVEEETARPVSTLPRRG